MSEQDLRQGEPAYTPRAEHRCDGSATHYQGCKCHEARHAEEIAKLREAGNGYPENKYLRAQLAAVEKELAPFRECYGPAGMKAVSKLIEERDAAIKQRDTYYGQWFSEAKRCCASEAREIGLRGALEKAKSRYWDRCNDGSGTVRAMSVSEFDSEINEAISTEPPALLGVLREVEEALVKNVSQSHDPKNCSIGCPFCISDKALASLRKALGVRG